MPLLAYTRSGEPLVAPLQSDDKWERLRASTDRDAWMAYRQRRAISKVSRLGTRFSLILRGMLLTVQKKATFIFTSKRSA